MILPTKFEADWALLRNYEEHTSIDRSKQKEKRIIHTYKVADKNVAHQPEVLKNVDTILCSL